MLINHRCITASLLAAMFILFPSPGICAEAAETENEVDPGYQIEIASDISINTETNTATIPVTGAVSAYHDLEIRVTSERSYQLVNEEGPGDDLAYEISEETILFSNKDGDTAMAIDCDITVHVSETPAVCGTYSDTMTFTMSSMDYTPEIVETTEAPGPEEDPDPSQTPEPAEDLVAEESGDATDDTTAIVEDDTAATPTISEEISAPVDAPEQTDVDDADHADNADHVDDVDNIDNADEMESATMTDDTAAPAAEQEDSTPLPETAPADLITNSIEESE